MVSSHGVLAADLDAHTAPQDAGNSSISGRRQSKAGYSSRYDTIARWYADGVRAGSPIHEIVVPRLIDLAAPLARLDVCDLACGEGVVSRELAVRGARVVGVDISMRLLALAVEEERRNPRGIHFVRDDASQLGTFERESFDGVVSSLALTDIADLRSVAAAVTRVLRPGGWLLFAINHPCGPASGPNGQLMHASYDYFEEGYWRSQNPASVRGRVGAYHRPLSTYLNTLGAAGLSLEHSLEPRATLRMCQHAAGYERVPSALIMRWRKSPLVKG